MGCAVRGLGHDSVHIGGLMSKETPKEKKLGGNQGRDAKEQAKALRGTNLGNQYQGGRPFGK